MRRAILGAAGMAGLAYAGSWLLPRSVRAERPEAAFAAKSAADALRALFGDTPIVPSERIAITLPELVEDGAVVPLTVTTDLPGVQAISVVSQKNPRPLIARFDFGEGANGGYLATRIKLAESEDVMVVVRAGDTLHSVQKYVKVMVGGCA